MLHNTGQIEDRIFKILAIRPGSTAQQLHVDLNSEGDAVSLRGVFKALRNLQDTDVAIKVGNSYSLRISWVLELRAFTDKILANYERKSVFFNQLPAAGASSVWTFPSPFMADDFWRQVAMALFDRTKKRNMFYWIRHAWFPLPSAEQELRFQETLKKTGCKLFIIVEGDTYLDLKELRECQHEAYTIAQRASPFHNMTCSSLTVIGEYVVTLSVAKHIREQIESLYKEIKDVDDLGVAAIKRLLSVKGRCPLRVEHNVEKARRLKRTFADFFGVSEEEF